MPQLPWLMARDYLGFLERIHDSKDAATGLASVWLGLVRTLTYASLTRMYRTSVCCFTKLSTHTRF